MREQRRIRRAEAHKAAVFNERIQAAKTQTLDVIRSELLQNGLRPVNITGMPIRFKRNERTYFFAGDVRKNSRAIAVLVTNQRLFHVDAGAPVQEFPDKGETLSVIRGVRTTTLASVIAIDDPISTPDYSDWKTVIHLDSGRSIPVAFQDVRAARRFATIVAELVDRLNDPIDESAFAPRRERIPEEVKIVVWRRDKGACVKCGARVNLEYDHIIPVSKGGSNTARNIELLCESCNRRKSDRIS